jgi:TetR/AcrR family transcriptional repressor of lmrAB and yxaGH operons
MADDPNTRERILATASGLFQRQGYHATGLNQVLAEGKAPKGSLYFHFPRGKEQLALLGARLVATGFRAGSPIATVALDIAGESEPIRVACAAAYALWGNEIAERFAGWGVPADRRAPLATVVIAAIEGALLLARVRQEVAPLHEVADLIGHLVLGD